MLILTIRTDKPDAEVGLYNDADRIVYHTWTAHRQLAETIHTTIRDVLEKQDRVVRNIQAIVIYRGPGSFTGLRIGFAVANALADGLGIPIVSSTGDEWQARGIQRLIDGENEHISLPEYGAEPNVSTPKK